MHILPHFDLIMARIDAFFSTLGVVSIFQSRDLPKIAFVLKEATRRTFLSIFYRRRQ